MDYASTGQVKQKKWSSGATVLDQLDYSYDSFGNLHTQANTLAGATASESYAYDGLQRLIQAARSGVPGNPQVTYGYAANGNPSYKSDFSTGDAGAAHGGSSTPSAVAKASTGMSWDR